MTFIRHICLREGDLDHKLKVETSIILIMNKNGEPTPTFNQVSNSRMNYLIT